ncbi:MAG: hypothetical protein IT245_01270 [Bacteroidia bacterium]|nr:hypothetical protein [Bacteroidia bacterium]
MKLLIPALGFFGSLKAPVGMLASAASSIRGGFSPLKASSQIATTKIQSSARSIGLDKTMSYLSTPLRSKASNGMRFAKDKAQNTAPFAAYSAAKIMRSKSAEGGFSKYKQRMDRATKYSSSKTSNSKANAQSFKSRTFQSSRSESSLQKNTNQSENNSSRSRKVNNSSVLNRESGSIKESQSSRSQRNHHKLKYETKDAEVKV